MNTETFLRSRMARKRRMINMILEGITGFVVGAMLGIALIGWLS